MSDTLVSGTAVIASGTSVDFTGIPATAKRITVMFSAASLSGTSRMQIQLGDSGGFETTGYVGTYEERATTTNVTALTNGFVVSGASSAYALNGFATINLLNSNIWTFSSNMASDAGRLLTCCGAKTLSDTLTQVRITTVNGTDVFDAGTINIMYE